MNPSFPLINPSISLDFATLPLLPKAEIAKHLNSYQRVALSVISEQWQEAISCQSEQFSLGTVQLECGDEESNVFIDFKYFNKKLHVTFINCTDYVPESEQEPNGTLIIYSAVPKGSPQLIRTCDMLSKKFTISFTNFETNEPLNFEDIINLDCYQADFDQNNLTAAQLNILIHFWVSGLKKGIQYWRFQISNDITIDQVIRGLKTEQWNLKHRKRDFSPKPQISIDLSAGYDIFNSHGALATVLINQSTLYFCVWYFPNSLKQYEKNVISDWESTDKEIRNPERHDPEMVEIVKYLEEERESCWREMMRFGGGE